MKKIYISLAMIAAGGVTLAQTPTTQNSQFVTKKINSTSQTLAQTKALGTTFWSNDFSTPADWTINNAGETAPMGWTIDAVNDSWAFSSAIASTSGGNYLELNNGDPTTNNPPPSSSTFTATTTTSIDVMTLAGTSNVLIQFEQYGALFQDMQEVQVSTDGISFVTVGNNADDIEPLTQSGGSAYANPMLRSYDISTAIAGNPSTVWIRFSWSPGAQAIAYGWFVDDVALVTKPDNDLKANANDWGSLGLHYYQIPLAQVAPVDFWSILSNEGSADQTNSMINVDVNAGTYTGSSATGVTITATNSDSVGITGLFTPPANGSYAFTWDASSDQVDDVPANNGLVGETFVVNDFIYARDTDGTPNASGGEDGGAPGDFAFEAGSLFDMFAAQQVFGIDVVIGSGTPDGTIIYGKIYELDQTGSFVYVDETAEYTTTTADATNNTKVVMQLFSAPTLNAGSTYIAVVGCYSEFFYGSSGYSPDQTSFIMYGGVGGAGSQYYTNGTPMVRMNFDGSIGVEESIDNTMSLGQNMPNPFNNNSTINFELENTSDVQFEFVDMTGKVVKTMDLGTLTNGAHNITVDAAEFAAGVYYYSLISGGNKVTAKMMVQK